jgi:hypothetical protein
VTRQERIAFLLEHLADVQAGVRDRGTGGDHIPLMCRCWNSPGYQEIERLLTQLRTEEPRLAWHLLERFFAPKRRVLSCTRCDWTTHAWSSVNFHQHGRRHVALVPRMLRMTSPQLRPELVDVAIGWLDERWHGGVFIPDELLPLVTTA